MNIKMQRIQAYPDFTLGSIKLDGVLEAWTLEDEKRQIKVKGETRIPAGKFKVELRKEGGMNVKYKAKYPWHQGMLWVRNVPGFEYIYIHIGNTDDDTAGCILVGNTANIAMNKITSSLIAYERIYKKIVDEINKGNEVWIEISDEV